MEEERAAGLRLGIVAGLLLYFAAGMAQLGRGDGERDHLFPFIAWNMFAAAPVRGPYYALVIRNGGRAYDPPRELGAAVGTDEQRRLDAVFMANSLAGAVAAGDAPRIAAARRAIEAKLLRAPWSYEVYEGTTRLASWSSP